MNQLSELWFRILRSTLTSKRDTWIDQRNLQLIVIDEVPLSLGRRGDTPAEANHSSINKRLGGGGARQLTDQVRLLLERQHEIVTGRLSDDTKHNHTSTVLSRQMKNDPSAQQAIITLSKYAYEKWSEERRRAREYVCNEQNDGCVKIVWPPSGACHEHFAW